MDRKLFYGRQSRELLQKGVDTIYNAVSTTMGAKGRTVLIEDKTGGYAQITKDGVTVAKNITVPDEVQRVAVDLLRTVSLKSNEEVGDGTTSSVVLAHGLITEGFKLINEGEDVNNILKGINLAIADVEDMLKQLTIPVAGDKNKIKNIAKVSGNNDEKVGTLVADAYNQVGNTGLVTVTNSRTEESFIEVNTGLKLPSGLITPIFINDISKGVCKLSNPAIMITDFKIDRLEPISELLADLFNKGRSVIIVCEDIDLQPLQILAHQIQLGQKVCVLRAPSYGEQQLEFLRDLATVTDGKVFSKELGHNLSTITVDDLGGCETFEGTVDTSFFYEGHGAEEDITARVELLRSYKGSEQEEREALERAAALEGGAAIIHVGAWSDTERSELRDRVIDAIYAVRASLSEGITSGGGSALYYISKKLMSSPNVQEKYLNGYMLLCKAIQRPLLKILENGGITDVSSLQNAQKFMGINVLTGEKVNMVNEGIIDPVKVIRVSLRNAISVASTMLTTECVVSNFYSDDDEKPNIF